MFELVKYDDQTLFSKTKEFDFSSPPFDPIEFSKELVKIMVDNKGMGLSANQVGVPYSIFSLNAYPENIVCFNPKIVWKSETLIELDEGCLSFPGIVIKNKRPETIRVRFQSPNGELTTRTFSGISSRVFQHEMDHLDGVTFFSHLSSLKFDMAVKKCHKKYGFNYNNLKGKIL